MSFVETSNMEQRPSRFSRYVLMLLPIATEMSTAIFTVISYVIAIRLGKIAHPPFVPFISDIGDFKPQSSVFSFGLSISALLSLTVTTVRYFQIKNLYTRCQKTNDVAFAVGILITVGKYIVASFELSSQIVVHFIGAATFFGGFVVYAFLQSYITYQIFGKTKIFVVRSVTSCGMLICGILFTVFLLPSLRVYNEHSWNVSNGAEWGYAALKMIYMITFVPDFQGLVPVFYVELIPRGSGSYEDLTEDYVTVELFKRDECKITAL